MKIYILLITLFFSSYDAFSKGHIDEISGTWESSRGAIYESDGSNFVCIYIPEQHMEKYSHWLNKNSLTDFRYTENGLMASQYLRKKNGEVSQVSTMIELTGNTIILRFKVPSRKQQYERVFIRVEEKTRLTSN